MTVAGLLAFGCGGSTSTDGAGGTPAGGMGGGAASGGGSSGGGAASGGGSSGGAASGGGSSGGSAGAGGSSAAPCSPAQPCAADEYCDYPDDRCGEGVSGKCQPRPVPCDLAYVPVCACDGQTHGNACGARAAGADLNAKGGCPPPVGMFVCGPRFCLAAPKQYCQHAVSDVGGTADEYICKAAPEECAFAPSCGCVKNEPCGAGCTGDKMGNMTLTCPGG